MTYLPVCLVLCLTLGAATASAEIYRWVDKDGKVHYSDTKPEDQASEIIQPDIPAPSQVPDEGEQRRLDLVREMQERAVVDARQQARQVEATPRRQTGDPGRCLDARIQISILHEQVPVYWTEDGQLRGHWSNDYYRGKRDYIADKDREQVKDRVWNDLYRYCPDPDNRDALDEAYIAWLDSEWCQIHTIALEEAARPSARSSKSHLRTLRDKVAAFCG